MHGELLQQPVELLTLGVRQRGEHLFLATHERGRNLLVELPASRGDREAGLTFVVGIRSPVEVALVAGYNSIYSTQAGEDGDQYPATTRCIDLAQAGTGARI